MTRRILGLGKAAQVVLLAIYRANITGEAQALPISDRRLDGVVAQFKYEGLARGSGGRFDLTPKGRAAVVRIAPLFLPVAFVLCFGCGPEFVGVDEPCVMVLDPGEPEAPTEDVLVVIDRQKRMAVDAGDQ